MSGSHAALDVLYVERHELGDKRLDVIDGFVAVVRPVLKDGGPVGRLVLEALVALLGQLLQQADEDDLGRDAVAQQLVDAVAHLTEKQLKNHATNTK